MSYKVLIERNVLKEVRKFPRHDIEKIKEVLNKLPDFPESLDVKKLAGARNIYRIRVGDYRILVELELHNLKVFSILHRKKAYK